MTAPVAAARSASSSCAVSRRSTAAVPVMTSHEGAAGPVRLAGACLCDRLALPGRRSVRRSARDAAARVRHRLQCDVQRAHGSGLLADAVATASDPSTHRRSLSLGPRRCWARRAHRGTDSRQCWPARSSGEVRARGASNRGPRLRGLMAHESYARRGPRSCSAAVARCSVRKHDRGPRARTNVARYVKTSPLARGRGGMTRAVVVASIRGRIVTLRPADNGSGFTSSDVVALATAAALLPRVTKGGVVIGLSMLPDFEAMAESRRVVVQRTGRAT